MNAAPENLLSSLGLSIGYQALHTQTVCLQSLAINIWPGQFICLLGANGSGKSTLLRTLAGIQKPLQGSISIAGQAMHTLSLRQRARRLSFVNTHPINHTGMLAYDYAALGRHPHSNWIASLQAHDHHKIQSALATVDATHLAQRPLHQLSDGESQRIAIARVLAQEVQILLMDEPTAFLDVKGRIELMQRLRNITHQSGLGTVLSTHDLDLALRYADQIWLISDDGHWEQSIPEALALNGSIAKAFSGASVQWDHRSGQFSPPEANCFKVYLQASGPERLWTQRALERIGIGLCPRPEIADYQLTIQATRAGPCWMIDTPDQKNLLRSESLSACVDYLIHLSTQASR